MNKDLIVEQFICGLGRKKKEEQKKWKAPENHHPHHHPLNDNLPCIVNGSMPSIRNVQ